MVSLNARAPSPSASTHTAGFVHAWNRSTVSRLSCGTSIAGSLATMRARSCTSLWTSTGSMRPSWNTSTMLGLIVVRGHALFNLSNLEYSRLASATVAPWRRATAPAAACEGICFFAALPNTHTTNVFSIGCVLRSEVKPSTLTVGTLGRRSALAKVLSKAPCETPGSTRPHVNDLHAGEYTTSSGKWRVCSSWRILWATILRAKGRNQSKRTRPNLATPLFTEATWSNSSAFSRHRLLRLSYTSTTQASSPNTRLTMVCMVMLSAWALGMSPV
mmetsp:Transcript_12200/g.34412  ORF Transcript_12200/g.34412 Transcript_12200/m.34412 type:complete len:274 (-) Transcript_12200:442-1263(-)